ncbi:rRNA maturation RNase YbeY [Chromobacterium sp. ATCC 53434]|uniref:rRNA maturation RNase YbeY n=1 Tax=Chromobacterium TaxID=535 RepID=UPI000C793466|nr:rRNA maturation RNase YbeY [Chromobacterium sp. ATCC 53434]AUH52672.1 rRNA maturation RNase YbeY [Chromobacterium sp. ATCC 53434]
MKKAKRNPLLARLAARLELSLDVRSDAAALPEPALIRRACQAALRRDVKQAQVSIIIVDAAEGRQLNNDYRGKDYATNVLSFALNEGEPVAGLPLFGDLVLCAPVVEQEAAEQGKDLMAHYAHLLVHGMLHLQGFDHEEDDEAEAMEALETVIVQQLGYPDPYHEEHI